MRKLSLIVAASACLALCGCQTPMGWIGYAPKTQPPITPALPPPITQTESDKNIAKNQAKVNSKVSAAAESIAFMNDKSPDGPSKVGIKSEVETIQNAVGKPTVEDQLAAVTRAKLYLEGKVAEAQKADTANKAAIVALQKQIETDQKKAEQEKQAMAKEWTDKWTKRETQFTGEMEVKKNELKAKDATITDLKNQINSKNAAVQTWILCGCSGLLVLIGAAITAALLYFKESPIPGIAISGMGSALFACSFLFKETWFLVSFGVLYLLAIIVIGFSVKKSYKKGKDVSVGDGAFLKVFDVVEGLVADAKKGIVEPKFVDDLLSRLSKAYDQPHKDLVDKIRASSESSVKDRSSEIESLVR